MKILIINLLFIIMLGEAFAQNNDVYLDNYNEINDIIMENFMSPFKSSHIINKGIHFRFGYNRNPFTGKIFYSTIGVFGCGLGENIYSMTDGVIKRIGFEDNWGSIIIIEYNDIEIHYLLVNSIAVKEGDMVNKGQFIGIVSSPYYSFGPALCLRIKYKENYFDPILLLDLIIK
jgi:murein DD-endopeptidase MepM/ murein hydrolase activator NlpD